MSYEKALSLISGGGSGGGITPAELVIDGTKFIVKATPDTIESVFVAVGNNVVIYRTYIDADDNTNANFMGIFDGNTISEQQFVYLENFEGYVFNNEIH